MGAAFCPAYRERISDHHYQRDKTKRTYTEQLDLLPDGTLVALESGGIPYLVLGGLLLPWSVEGYGAPIARPASVVEVLTPRSTVRVIVHGYRPEVHPSAGAALVIAQLSKIKGRSRVSN